MFDIPKDVVATPRKDSDRNFDENPRQSNPKKFTKPKDKNLKHQKHEKLKNKQKRESIKQKLRPNRLLLRLLTLDHNIVGKEVIH